MKLPDQYPMDIRFFFDRHPVEWAVYQALLAKMEERFPDSSVKVQKSQVSFYGRHLFAAVSLPVRRKKGWPRECLVLTLGLARPLDSPRAAVSVEPYPGRWTNHVLLTRPEEVDEELLLWLQEAWDFAQSKR